MDTPKTLAARLLDDEAEAAKRAGREAAERVSAAVYDAPGRRAHTPPAKDTGETEPRGCPTPGACSAAATIADLEARLAEATNELHCCDDVPLDKGLAEGIASLRRERDEARSSLETARLAHMSVVRELNARASRAESSLETAERRIGELEAALNGLTQAVKKMRAPQTTADVGLLILVFAPLLAAADAALTPDAGTARSEDEEEE